MSVRNLVAVAALLIAGPLCAETIAITGATVHTVGPQGTLKDATIVIEDGRIAMVGARVQLPAGARIIEADGKVVTPGLFTPYGQLGLVEVGLSAGSLDGVQRGEHFTASFDIADAFNPRSTLIAVNRIDGITRAMIAPTAATPDMAGNTSHVISGLAAVVDLSGDTDSVDRRAVAMVVNLGERGRSFAAAESRAAPLLVLRNALDEAIDYRDHRLFVEQGQRRDYVHSINDLEALQSVLAGTTPVLANVHRASDIRALLGIADDYGLRVIVNGGAEAWMLADELARADVDVILAPTANLPSNFDRINARLGAAKILADAGVRIAFADGRDVTHNARNITQSAGNAIVDGLGYEEALRAVTLAPAEIFGVADVTGSLESGKVADVVIWPDDPFELTVVPEHVFINGEEIELVSRQTLLRDRYLGKDAATPPAYRK